MKTYLVRVEVALEIEATSAGDAKAEAKNQLRDFLNNSENDANEEPTIIKCTELE